MKTIAFSSQKGGTGKTSLAILSANFCAAAGRKVLVIDMDAQNSISSYYVGEGDIDQHNMAIAFNTRNLSSNILSSDHPNIDLVPSHATLDDFSALNERVLAKILAPVKGYDLVIIDCAPTLSNLARGAWIAADLIISPVFFDMFNFKGAKALHDHLAEIDKLSGWRILINAHRPPHPASVHSESHDYEKTLRSMFGKHILPFYVPDTTLVRRTIDGRRSLTRATRKAELFTAVSRLCALFGVADKPEAF